MCALKHLLFLKHCRCLAHHFIVLVLLFSLVIFSPPLKVAGPKSALHCGTGHRRVDDEVQPEV